jgi:hypothetical protein
MLDKIFTTSDGRKLDEISMVDIEHELQRIVKEVSAIRAKGRL